MGTKVYLATKPMKNWNTDLQNLRRNKEKYQLWRLAQLINFGLDGAKLSLKELRENWSQLVPKIDPRKRKVLDYYLWGKNPF